MQKMCSKCGKSLPLDDFYRQPMPSNPDYRRSDCKKCMQIRTKKYAHKYATEGAIVHTITKTCCRCKKLKYANDFSKNKYQKDGLAAICKTCRSEERRTEYMRQQQNDQNKRRRARDPIRFKMQTLLILARNRSRSEKVPFDLTVDYLISLATVTCPVLGILLDFHANNLCDASPTLDKFIPALGYVRGNVSIISFRANSMKRNATVEEVGKLYRWMLDVTELHRKDISCLF